MVGKASSDSAAVCCVSELESKRVKERERERKREGGEKARQLEKVTLPVAHYVIPTGTGI